MRSRSCRNVLMLCVTVAAAGAIASRAAADGLPVVGVDAGSEGVAAHGGAVRYVTLSSARDTILAQTATAGGRILGVTRLRGTFTIPAVAYDGSSSGLSADGSTLVLIRPQLAFPRARTTFAVLDALPLQVRKILVLPGDFSFDAISPDGSTIFLIQYLSATDPTRYHVRAYSLRSWRLLPRPVVDPHESGDAMRGSPISRATSPDGRWAYTLYDGAGGTPFVHALDTLRRTARCIDLPLLAGRQDLWQLRLTTTPTGRTLAVSTSGHPLALVDTTDFRVSPPPVPGQTPSRHGERPWLLGAAAVAAALAAAAISTAVRRRRGRLALLSVWPPTRSARRSLPFRHQVPPPPADAVRGAQPRSARRRRTARSTVRAMAARRPRADNSPDRGEPAWPQIDAMRPGSSEASRYDSSLKRGTRRSSPPG